MFGRTVTCTFRKRQVLRTGCCLLVTPLRQVPFTIEQGLCEASVSPTRLDFVWFVVEAKQVKRAQCDKRLHELSANFTPSLRRSEVRFVESVENLSTTNATHWRVRDCAISLSLRLSFVNKLLKRWSAPIEVDKLDWGARAELYRSQCLIENFYTTNLTKTSTIFAKIEKKNEDNDQYRNSQNKW